MAKVFSLVLIYIKRWCIIRVNKKEMEAMRKRIRELEMENEILKKATAIFARKP